MPERRRVAVTGLGTVSCVGVGIEAFSASIREGRVGSSPITSFDTTGFPAVTACEVRDFDPGAILDRVRPDRWGPSAVFAAAAGRLAVTDAGLEEDLLARSRTGTVMGTTGGEAPVVTALVEQWVDGGPAAIDPALLGKLPAGRIATAVNHELGLTGPAQTVPTACSASNFALGHAYDLIVSGEADFMIAGGADAVNRSTHAGFLQLGALATDVSRPFDVDRSGILTGEGGVALLLEPWETAQARGARIYAELLGYAANCDARHMVNPDADSIAECIRMAHECSGIQPDDVDYICAHGTGTPTNDSTEVAAVREVFPDRLPPISSIKSMIGHTMGAASGFGAAICCKALQEGFLPPTANLRTLDPALGPGVDPIAGTARPASPRVVQNHGFAFGGNNAITMFGRAA